MTEDEKPWINDEKYVTFMKILGRVDVDDSTKASMEERANKYFTIKYHEGEIDIGFIQKLFSEKEK